MGRPEGNAVAVPEPGADPFQRRFLNPILTIPGWVPFFEPPPHPRPMLTDLQDPPWGGVAGL